MNSIEQVISKQTDDQVVLKVGAGVTWRMAIEWAKNHLQQEVLPFDSPSGPDVSIAGAFSAHTVSRTIDTKGRYMPDYVDKLTLITPEGTLQCTYPADATLQSNTESNHKEFTRGITAQASEESTTFHGHTGKQICALLPGSLGRFGVITDIEIRLRKMPPSKRIKSTLIDERFNLHDFIELYVQTVSNPSHKEQYDHGTIGVLQWSNPDNCRGFLLGAELKEQDEVAGLPSFPGFEGPTFFNQLAYTAGHTFTRSKLNETGLRYYTPVNTTGADKPYEWMYFHDSLAQARNNLEYHSLATKCASYCFGLDKALRVAHQAWFIPGDNAPLLESFIKEVWQLMHFPTANQQRFNHIKNMVLLQDLLRLPKSRHPAHITYHKGHGHTYTLTLAVHNDREEAESIEFFKTITEAGEAMGVTPMLLKGNHMSDETLRRSQQYYINTLADFIKKADPDNLVTSLLWQRLLPDAS